MKNMDAVVMGAFPGSVIIGSGLWALITWLI